MLTKTNQSLIFILKHNQVENKLKYRNYSIPHSNKPPPPRISAPFGTQKNNKRTPSIKRTLLGRYRKVKNKALTYILVEYILLCF